MKSSDFKVILMEPGLFQLQGLQVVFRVKLDLCCSLH